MNYNDEVALVKVKRNFIGLIKLEKITGVKCLKELEQLETKLED